MPTVFEILSDVFYTLGRATAESKSWLRGDRKMHKVKEIKINIIMSTHGRSGVTRWLMGSVTDKLVRYSPVPVLTISLPGCRNIGRA